MQYLGQQTQRGNVESFEPAFLKAHGGDLSGFILLRGDRNKLDQMKATEEFQRFVLRGQITIEHFGVVDCDIGAGIQR